MRSILPNRCSVTSVSSIVSVRKPVENHSLECQSVTHVLQLFVIARILSRTVHVIRFDARGPWPVAARIDKRRSPPIQHPLNPVCPPRKQASRTCLQTFSSTFARLGERSSRPLETSKFHRPFHALDRHHKRGRPQADVVLV